MDKPDLSIDFVVRALKLRGAAETNFRLAWALVRPALEHVGAGSWNNLAAAIATLKVETGDFACREERGSPEYFTRYDGRANLGNIQPGDGWKYRGRGFIQLTGRANYTHFGPLIGEDIASNPDVALHPPVAAMIFAAYWKERGCIAAAEAGNWQKVRLRVNGGTNGLGLFRDTLAALGAAI